MIETILRGYLDAALNTGGTEIPVLLELPEVPSESYPVWPEQLVVIQKVGGGKTNQISSASFAIQSYGSTLYNAASLDEDVRAVMEGFAALDDVSACGLSSNYNHTDTQMKVYRYQSVYDITHY